MSLRAITTAFRPLCIPTRRSFTTTHGLCLKEDADRSAAQVEKAKQDQLQEQKEGKGRWREDLASQGESNIAADKKRVQDHDSHIAKLQEETAKKSEQGNI